MNRDDLAAARQTIAAALAEVYALCQGEHRTGGHRFRMSIPVEQTDSDIVLLKGLQAGEAALDELAALPPTGSPETPDVEAAVGVLMRAGLFNPTDIGIGRARDLAIDLLLTATTGERYDLDDDHLTPPQREARAALEGSPK